MKTSPQRERAVRAALVLAGVGAGWLGKSADGPKPAAPPPAAPVLASRADAAASAAHAEGAAAPAGDAARDALAARFGTAMLQSSPFQRQADFVRALETLRPEDADGLIQLFDRLDRQGMHFPNEWQAFYQRWGAVDPERALAHALAAPESKWAPGAMKDALRGWAARDPAAALGWMEKLPPSPTDGTWPGLTRVLQRWQQADPQALQTWLQNPQSGGFRDSARAIYQSFNEKKPAPPAPR